MGLFSIIFHENNVEMWSLIYQNCYKDPTNNNINEGILDVLP